MERKFEGPPSLSIGAISSLALHDESAEQLVYLFDGSGSANGTPVARDTAIHVPPGASLELRGAMTVLVSTCPVSFRAAETARNPPPQGIPRSARNDTRIVRLEDAPVQTTGDRWYRELIQGETTMFVGSIPPGRAPDHFHLYEEVLCILDGVGVMHQGGQSTPIARGSCAFLPRTQRHCVENTGSGELRLLGVFYPAGSPAVRYPA
jgi:mannose-6-phosphate isomerase-like protein (cupin superfamily)